MKRLSLGILAGIFGFFLFSVLNVAMADAGDITTADYLSQVVLGIKSLGGISGVAKAILILGLVTASLKVSIARQYFWDKLGGFKVLVAPVIALSVGVLQLPQVTWSGLGAYLFVGGGAIILHELLDGVKAWPGIGPAYVTVIDFVSGLLGGK